MTYQFHTISKQVLGDLQTPVSIYLKVRDIYPESALLESSDFHGNTNSLSFIALCPLGSIGINRGTATLKYPDGQEETQPLQPDFQVQDAMNRFLSCFEIRGNEARYVGLFGYTSFDAVKYIYGISMVDIAVLMNVSYGVVFRAKNCGIPAKRVRQFCDILCISPEALNNQSTSVFAELEEGKKKFYAQTNIQIELSSMPKWKENIAMALSQDWLRCPIHFSREFARIDKFDWSPDLNKNNFTPSERMLIDYLCKHNRETKPLVHIRYDLHQSCRPHIKCGYYGQQE